MKGLPDLSLSEELFILPVNRAERPKPCVYSHFRSQVMLPQRTQHGFQLAQNVRYSPVRRLEEEKRVSLFEKHVVH